MPGQCRAYINENGIGSPPLVADDPLLLHMMHGMGCQLGMLGFNTMLLGSQI